MPRRARIRPTTVRWVRSTRPPAVGCERPSRPGRCTGPWAAQARQHGPQGHQHGVGGLLRPELGVEQPLRRVIEHGEERLAPPGAAGQPFVITAVQVQELADARPGLAAPAMAAAGPRLGDEARRLQGELHERVRERHAVIPPGDVESGGH